MDSTTAPFANTGYELDDLYIFANEERLDDIESGMLAATAPYVVAQFLSRLEVDERRTVLRKIDNDSAGEVLSEMDAEDAADVLEAMREPRAVSVLEGLNPDDTADIMAEMETADQERLLDGVTPETASTIRELFEYPSDTAGGIMTPDVATVSAQMSVIEAVRHIQKLHDELEHIYYIYVVDNERKLLGIVSMRDLVMAQPEEIIGEIMQTDLRGVIPVEMDQEEVASEMATHNYHALPVVDSENQLLGIVTDDDIIDVIQEEATEDIQKLLGAGGDENIHDPIGSTVVRRNPWLLLNLVSAFFAGGVISLFEDQIAELTILAVCMPIVASLGGNTGGQSLAVVIRSLAMGDIHSGEERGVCLREGIKGMLNGIAVGVVAALTIYIFTQRLDISGVVLAAMLLSMTYAGAVGAFIPLALKKFGLDPAQSSQMFLTASTDIIGFAIFLGLGTWLLL